MTKDATSADREVRATQNGRILKALSQVPKYDLGSEKSKPLPLLGCDKQLADYFKDVRKQLLEAESEDGSYNTEIEWFLDNDYIVQRSIQQVKYDLPLTFYKRLPSTKVDNLAFPQSYKVAADLLESEHCLPDFAGIVHYINQYQEHAPLTIAELWAFPSMLRMRVLEILFVSSSEQVTPSQLKLKRALRALKQEHSTEHLNPIANAIRTLHTLDTISWEKFFCEASIVEQTLSKDPAAMYPRQTFDTSDRYRKKVEELARDVQISEASVAEFVVSIAGSYSEEPKNHVGYYLEDDGQKELEQLLGFKPSWKQNILRFIKFNATVVYFFGLSIFTTIFLAAPLIYLSQLDAGIFLILLALILSLVPALTLGTTVVQWFVTKLLPPSVLPKLDLSKGFTEAEASLVVIPTLIGSRSDIAKLVRQIEIHYLANADPMLEFALLTDFCDSPTESNLEDEELLHEAVRGIQILNNKYGNGGSGPFHLLHRARRWNNAEQCWMGWERKRGKLEELVAFLDGSKDTSFSCYEGRKEALFRVNYVITLDTDTQLPRTTAHSLVGTLAHPLNKPRIDQETGRLTRGYTIIQPRVEIGPQLVEPSRFLRIYGGDTALDLYSHAVSDVYQDLFGEGIYVGKGVFHARAFRKTLEGRVPENSILSHDLFEGIHGKAGLVTDIVLFEDYPPHYLGFCQRMERWIRGDWQLLPWLSNLLPLSSGSRVKTHLSLISRWKIIDNLRRSLVPVSLLFLLLVAWFAFPGDPLIWILLVLAVPAAQLFTTIASSFAIDVRRTPLRQSIQGLRNGLQENVARWFLAIAFLPYESFVTLQAILRTLFRLYVSRRNLLQWRTAAITNKHFSNRRRLRTWMAMLSAPITAVVSFVFLFKSDSTAFVYATPLLALWALSPEIALWISKPTTPKREEISQEETLSLRALARRTWLFFETFVGPDNQWLPPDHFQENPLGIVAHRTSPTNIGMMLISTLAARDFGYLSLSDLTSRLKNTFDTLDKLERHKGHLLNWYNTSTLEPLLPRYVSTVDSGNLAASFIVLKQGLAAATTQPVIDKSTFTGLLDTVALIEEAIETAEAKEICGAVRLKKSLSNFRKEVASKYGESDKQSRLLDYVCEEVSGTLKTQLHSLIKECETTPNVTILREIYTWLERLEHQARTIRTDLHFIDPSYLVHQKCYEFCKTNDISVDTEISLQEIIQTVPLGNSLRSIPSACEVGLNKIRILESTTLPKTLRKLLEELKHALTEGRENAQAVYHHLLELCARSDAEFHAIDFSFLYDNERELFYIGFNATADQFDKHHYDLLASEARVASYIAIAKGDVPQKHWYQLGRPLTKKSGSVALLSWSATMFEYLMPPLFMRSEEQSLLSTSVNRAIEEQINYSVGKNVPWGISESGFYQFDSHQNYQYRAFGVPTLGFKRGLEEDVVIAPYASLLAVSFRPKAVCENIVHLKRIGALGRFGLYEAVDFTPSRVEKNIGSKIVQSYMSHHQGMIFVALANYLANSSMPQRFHSDSIVKTAEFLLHERIPGVAINETPQLEQLTQQKTKGAKRGKGDAVSPITIEDDAMVPAVHLLSNGSLSSSLTSSGGGGISWKGVSITSAAVDGTLDLDGYWIYIKDGLKGQVFSVTKNPCGSEDTNTSTTFYPHMAEFHNSTEELGVKTDVVVAPEHNVEIRRVVVSNHTEVQRELSLTSCAEVVLDQEGSFRRHPAFSRLFVTCEEIDSIDGMLLERRKRSPKEQHPVLGHFVHSDCKDFRYNGFEASRERFLGRNLDYDAVVMPEKDEADSKKSTQTLLDPIFSITCSLTLQPRSTETVYFLTVVEESRTKTLENAKFFLSRANCDWTFQSAANVSQQQLSNLDVTDSLFKDANQLLVLTKYPLKSFRDQASFDDTGLCREMLWPYGISGDLPIVLVKSTDSENLEFIENLLVIQRYWARCGYNIDIIILTLEASSYGDTSARHFYDLIEKYRLKTDTKTNIKRGSVYLVRADQTPDQHSKAMRIAAKVILDADAGNLTEQVQDFPQVPTPNPNFLPQTAVDKYTDHTPSLERPNNLLFDNGLGGFSKGGDEHIIHLEPGVTTPAPWCNVLANESFGCLMSESGLGCTWNKNSGENRITPWRNDPLRNTPAEVLYLRDEETAAVWSATPSPNDSSRPYQIAHGIGYSSYLHHNNGLTHSTRVFVSQSSPVKFTQLKVTNCSPYPRRITVTYYLEWVLGVDRVGNLDFQLFDYDDTSGTLLARNIWNTDFSSHVAFLGSDRPVHGVTADRREFLGRNGNYAHPEALKRWGLSGSLSPESDSCAALQVHLEIAANETVSTHFVVGQGENVEQALELAARNSQTESATNEFGRVQSYWQDVLGNISVSTPDKAMNLMLNRWLLYQTVSSRIYGRTGFYQSSGAYGFRDQLQDTMALTYSKPELCRKQILRAASKQFEEGDVLHWWHPPKNRGVRTRCSDDLVWLPATVAHYIDSTGDISILEEQISLLSAEALRKDEVNRYAEFKEAERSCSLYDHCLLALKRSAETGEHGLPLIGDGDWNDGMDLVGHGGKGESVWLAWFLADTLQRFSKFSLERGDSLAANNLVHRAKELVKAVDDNAWDGGWYRRAYFDNGNPVGSSGNQECKIDSIAQSWAAMVKGNGDQRVTQALSSAYSKLVSEEDNIIRLLWPPFDKSLDNPGYIMGYPPGIRENGGQYTHAAIWLAWAFAKIGDGVKAHKLFQMLNPINHSSTKEDCACYRVEPYVIAADIYSEPPFEGRGGWTWYTGSAAWMWRLGIEAILGLNFQGGELTINPCIPPYWPEFTAQIKKENYTCTITVKNPQNVSRGVSSIILDGLQIESKVIPLDTLSGIHHVEVILGDSTTEDEILNETPVDIATTM